MRLPSKRAWQKYAQVKAYFSIANGTNHPLISDFHVDKRRCINLGISWVIEAEEIFQAASDTSNITMGEKWVTCLTNKNSPRSSFTWAENVIASLIEPLTFRYTKSFSPSHRTASSLLMTPPSEDVRVFGALLLISGENNLIKQLQMTWLIEQQPQWQTSKACCVRLTGHNLNREWVSLLTTLGLHVSHGSTFLDLQFMIMSRPTRWPPHHPDTGCAEIECQISQRLLWTNSADMKSWNGRNPPPPLFPQTHWVKELPVKESKRRISFFCELSLSCVSYWFIT